MDIRLEWESAIGQDSPGLLGAKGSVGLLLSDFCDLLGLDQRQRERVLGVPHANQIEEYLDGSVSIQATEGGSDS